MAKANEANQILRDEYRKLNEEWSAFVRKETQEFEAKRQGRIEAAVALKIDVAPRFQPVVDEFLKTIK